MKLIDISHVLDGDTPIFPGDYQTTLSPYKTIEKDYYNAFLLQSGLHTGTHIDMPMHLIEHDKTAADFPLDGFCGKGVLLDVRTEASIAMKPIYESQVHEEDVVLLYTGWDKSYSKPDYFTRHPIVGEALAEFLLSRKIKMLGMDMPAPDAPPFTFHKDLLRHGIFVLENLTNLDSLTAVESFTVMAFPLKINAEASLVRAVCQIGGIACV